MTLAHKRELDTGGTTPPSDLPDLDDIHLWRLHNCGNLGDHVSLNGKLVTKRRYCGMFRHCKYCLHNRAMGYRKRLLLLLQGDPDAKCQQFTMASNADATELRALLKSIGEEKYMCLPQADGSAVIFADQSCTIPESYQATTLDEDTVRAIDFTKLVNTPEGRHVSGTLGRPSKDKIEDGKEHVEFEVVTINTGAKAEAREECFMSAVIEDSVNPAPTDVAELQNAMNRRANLYAEHLKARGHKVSTFKSYEHYYMTCSRTSISNSWLRFEVGKEYLASQYIEDYVEWRALVRSATDPQTISLDEKVSGD
jgi:hypothetical protein